MQALRGGGQLQRIQQRSAAARRSNSAFSSSRPVSSSQAPNSSSRRGRQPVVVMAAAGGDKPTVLVNSCTGKMGVAVAEAAARAGLDIAPYTLVGEDARSGQTIEVAGRKMELVGPAQRDALLERLKQQHPGLIVVDYTVPGALSDAAAAAAAARCRSAPPLPPCVRVASLHNKMNTFTTPTPSTRHHHST